MGAMVPAIEPAPTLSNTDDFTDVTLATNSVADFGPLVALSSPPEASTTIRAMTTTMMTAPTIHQVRWAPEPPVVAWSRRDLPLSGAVTTAAADLRFFGGG